MPANEIEFTDIPFLEMSGDGALRGDAGVDLLIPLNVQDSKPLYEQIYQFIKEEIRCGNLEASKKLPSSRALAMNLKVSRSTTQLAYEQLVSEGYLEAIPRKGYFVADIEGMIVTSETTGMQEKEQSGAFPGNHGVYDEDAAAAQGAREREYRVDFSLRGIDLDSFPYSTWRKISRLVLKEEEKALFLKGDPQGDLPFRMAIREYLHNARGVDCTVDQIVVGAGNEYLLMLLSQLLGRDAGIAMENPTYEQAYRVLSGMGHEIYPVDMDENGLNVSVLRRTSAKVAYVMPSHQFPMGIVMPVKRRQELLAWANESPGRYLIEDDYDSEFRYKGKPIPALQGADTAGKVIYIGTFSKAIAPAIRVSFMVLPPKLLRRYHEECNFYSSTVSRIDQRILNEFIKDGYFERYLNKTRKIYREKHDLLLQELKPFGKRFTISGEHAGLHVVMTAKDEKLSEQELRKAAADKGIKVYAFSDACIEAGGYGIPEAGARIILGYGGLKREEIQEGITKLKQAWL